MKYRSWIFSTLLLMLLAVASADAQSFYRRKGRFYRRYQTEAVTSPMLQTLPGRRGHTASMMAHVDVPPAARRLARHQEKEARREQRRTERIERRWALAKGVQERSFLGDAIVDHDYVRTRPGR